MIHSWGMATMYEGDVCESLRAMPAGSVHCCVTSPPYWALRSYLKKDHPFKSLEIGSEQTPDAYVEKLVGVFAEVRRVLRDDGVLFVNIGDTYAGGGRGGNPEESEYRKQATNAGSLVDKCPTVPGLKPLDRVGIPWRFALAMQRDGWYLRDEIIWAKPAPMPLSVNGWRWERCKVKTGKCLRSSDRYGVDGVTDSDIGNKGGAQYSDCPGCPKCTPNDGYVLRKGSWRTTTAHEQIFMFTKTDSYFCDAEAVKEQATAATIQRNQYSRVIDDPDEQFAVAHDHEFVGLTRNPRSVWTIGPDPFKGAHYAVFPREIPARCIQAATSAKGCCPKCGACRARMVESTSFSLRPNSAPLDVRGPNASAFRANGDPQMASRVAESKTLGWRPSCGCGGELAPVPCTVLDCFAGSFTTGEVAVSMNRRAVGCELNSEYVAIARKRLVGAASLFVQEAG